MKLVQNSASLVNDKELSKISNVSKEFMQMNEKDHNTIRKVLSTFNVGYSRLLTSDILVMLKQREMLYLKIGRKLYLLCQS